MSSVIQPYRYVVSGGTGAGGAPAYSVSLNGSNQYLSMSNANWGSYNRSKFAIAGSFRIDGLSSPSYYAMIAAKEDNPSGREYRVFVQNDGTFTFQWFLPFRADNRSTSSGAIVASNWYSFLVHFDEAATQTAMWLNGSAVGSSSSEPTEAVNTTSFDVQVGATRASGSVESLFDGLIYSLGFFSGSLPTPSDIFDGTSGKVKDFTGLSGLYSYLTCDGASPIYDAVKGATAWTNNNAATASSTIP